MKNLIIASTSTVHGSGFLEYLLPELRIFFNEIQELIFVPYARPGGISHEQYTEKVRQVFSGLNIKVKGLHEFEDTTKAIQQAEGIFVGGGNTFVLVDQLYKNNLISEIYDLDGKGTANKEKAKAIWEVYCIFNPDYDPDKDKGKKGHGVVAFCGVRAKKL